jgi:hypothetical protein
MLPRLFTRFATKSFAGTGLGIGIDSRTQGYSSMFRCYHNGCDFETNDLGEYERHGAIKHLENPLLYPSKYEIKKYSLKPQDKEWEV